MPWQRLLRRLFPILPGLLGLVILLAFRPNLIPTQADLPQDDSASPGRPHATPACAGGLIYDDGDPNSSLTFSGTPNLVEATRFNLPASPIQLIQVCLCWFRGGSDTDLIFDLMIFADSGSGPGALLQSVPNLGATGVSFSGSFYDYPVSLNLSGSSVYIGARWDSAVDQNFGLCLDSSVAGSTQISQDGGGSWPTVRSDFAMIRAQAPVPVSITASGGTPQNTIVSSSFAAVLQATVFDASGSPLPGAAVTFNAPASGPGGVFAATGTPTQTVFTNSSGVAASSAFIANLLVGSYIVTADTNPPVGPANFLLTNTPGSPANLNVTSGDGQATTVNNAFPLPLGVRVTDAFGNGVPGITVIYTPPGEGPSATFPGGNTAVTNANGDASVPVNANQVPGNYSVIGDLNPSIGAVIFNLSNLPAPVIVSAISGPADENQTLTPTYTIVLGSAPTAPVNVSIAPDSQCLTNTGLLVFDGGNWSFPQTVTVTAVDDFQVEGTHQCFITHTATSDDPGYNGATAGSVVVTILDNDSVGLVFWGDTSINETGDNTAIYTVHLNNALQAEEIVTVSISYDASQITVTPLVLVFTSGNWNLPQSVFVTAIDDGITEGVQSTTILHNTSSTLGGSPYQGLAIALVITIGDVEAFSWAPACVIADARINKDQRWDCDPPVAIYCTGAGVEIWAISNSIGVPYLSVSYAQIDAVGVPLDHNVTIAEAPGVILSRLTTGELQVNAWKPDPYWPGGKPYIIAWDKCPPSYVDHLSP